MGEQCPAGSEENRDIKEGTEHSTRFPQRMTIEQARPRENDNNARNKMHCNAMQHAMHYYGKQFAVVVLSLCGFHCFVGVQY